MRAKKAKNAKVIFVKNAKVAPGYVECSSLRKVVQR